MKNPSLRALTAAFSLFATSAFAGHQVAPAPEKEVRPAEVRTFFPDEPRGAITVGAAFSEDGVGVFVDAITGLWAPQSRNAFLFLDSRYSYEDNGQFVSSAGLGFRVKCPSHDVIMGVNAFWDSLHSARGNDFDQLGLGFEMLTRWVDARFNYYLPEDDQYTFGRSSDTTTTTRNGGVTEVTRRRSFKRVEAALEGFNTEIGFLIPGLDKYAEVRIYGGYYNYDTSFGRRFDGFKARLEAHLLPGVIADVEYWDDEELMNGHWTVGARVSVPFSIYNLVTGRNPFEGAADYFRPRQREFKERMGDMVIRSNRIKTAESGDILVDRSSSSKTVGVVRGFGKNAGGGGAGDPFE